MLVPRIQKIAYKVCDIPEYKNINKEYQSTNKLM